MLLTREILERVAKKLDLPIGQVQEVHISMTKYCEYLRYQKPNVTSIRIAGIGFLYLTYQEILSRLDNGFANKNFDYYWHWQNKRQKLIDWMKEHEGRRSRILHFFKGGRIGNILHNSGMDTIEEVEEYQNKINKDAGEKQG